jgi:pilus assembly protein Flp/PilA
MLRPAEKSTACRPAAELSGWPRSFRVSSGFGIMQNLITEALRRDHGGTAVEYGLIAALIAAVIAGVVAAVGVKLNLMFANFLNAF